MKLIVDELFLGIKFVYGTSINRFLPREDNQDVVGQVELKDGRILPADIVILGIGSTLYTNWMKDSGVKLLDNGSVQVDKVHSTYAREFYIFRFEIIKIF